MNSNIHRYTLLLSIGIGLQLMPSHAQEDSSDPEAVAILTEVAERLVGIDQTSMITLTESDRHDSIRTRQFRLSVHYPQPRDSIQKQMLLEMLYPEKIAGQKYWFWKMTNGRERKWIYLPVSGKCQEFSQRRGGRNTDLELGELEITSEKINSHTNQMLDDQVIQGRKNVVIKCTEKADSSTARRRGDRRSSYKLLWIDPGSCLVMKAEIYTSRNRLLKRLTVEKTEICKGWELASVIRVWDDQKKTETVITIEEISLEPIADDSLFRPSIGH